MREDSRGLLIVRREEVCSDICAAEVAADAEEEGGRLEIREMRVGVLGGEEA